MATDNLAWAISEFGPNVKRHKGYRKYERYYDGNQPLAFATPKYARQFWALFRGYSDNMCQSVVDVQAERLEVIGFTSSKAVAKTLTYDSEGNEVDPANPPMEDKPNPLQTVDPVTGEVSGPDAITVPAKTVTITIVDDPIGETAWDEWEAESMPLVADQVHSDVFKYGDAFVIADTEGVWRQHPTEMAVRYSKERPGVIECAAKMWVDSDGHARLNVYEQRTKDGPGIITKYRSKEEVKKVSDVKSEKDLDAYNDGEDDGDLAQGIPVVHFANKTYGQYGISELKPVIPLQDALNKAEMDLIVSMEYQAFRQRWVAGVDVELDDEGKPKGFIGEHGAGKYLAFADPDVKVGEFAGGELKPYVDVIENIRAQIARVTGIPPHYFFVGSSGATVSGETLKVGESRFTRKGLRQQRCIGKGWEDLMDLALEILPSVDDGAEAYDAEADLNTGWEEISPRSEGEEMDVLIKKGTIGIPNSQLQSEAGYDPDQIAEFAVEYAQNVKAGLQAAPSKNAENQNMIPAGAGSDTSGPTSQVSADEGTAPPVK